MVFIPGCLDRETLQSLQGRIELLRLLLTEDMPQSIKLASSLEEQFKKELKILPVPNGYNLSYLTKFSLYSGKEGVYSRNLRLTRLIHGPIAYGESLYQDNEKEYPELSKETYDFFGIKTSKRIWQVAFAYYQAILNYLSKKDTNVTLLCLPAFRC